MMLTGSLLAAAAALFTPFGAHSPAESCGKAELLRAAFEHGMMPSLEKPLWLRKLEGLTDTDVISCNVDLEPGFAGGTLAGSNTMSIRSLVNGLNQFHFRLADNLGPSSVTLNGTPITFVREDATNVRAEFPSSFNTGDVFTLRIDYSGTPNGAGFGSISFGTHSGAQYCFTLSEPWLAYTWWPNKDDNTDKALMSIAITVPNTMQANANGIRQGVDNLSGNRLRYRYASVNPMSPYLLCFGATNFNRFTDTYTGVGGPMPMEFFIYPENDTTANRNSWLATKTMISTLSPFYGNYPFLNEKYGVYQFNFGGGMEHQTMTGQGTFSENVTVHELGHQWWGDNVTCATWSDIWLNEGFATYTEAVWLEKKSGSTGAPALKSAMQSRKPTSFAEATYIPNPTDVNRIFSTNYTYRKGGWVLHMLRHVLGDSAFWAGMAAYRAQYALGTATTYQYRDAMAASSGKNLTQFFDQWIFQPGAAQYEYGYANTNVAGQNYVMLHIKQVQSGSYPTYAMPIDIKTTVNAATSTTVVQNSARTQNYLIPTANTASSVLLDDDGWILNTGVANVAYVPGPPKVIRSTPLPGATFGGSQRMTVTFHTNVNLSPSNVALRRIATGTDYPIGVVYNPSTFTVAISPIQKLPAGAYEIRISDAVTAVDSGQALDGELNGTGAAAYPSGNGIPAGGLVIPFNVVYT